ncbi:conserved hypothetical protein [Trichinella spiralis]|uniref:hypothetical protein n=1 Tax=Trichinella spiralis TaxID=6334 RepID=UPI0001EFCB59|nr:conserved hypothetical protein [Trichinella spiralis]
MNLIENQCGWKKSMRQQGIHKKSMHTGCVSQLVSSECVGISLYKRTRCGLNAYNNFSKVTSCASVATVVFSARMSDTRALAASTDSARSKDFTKVISPSVNSCFEGSSHRPHTSWSFIRDSNASPKLQCCARWRSSATEAATPSPGCCSRQGCRNRW